MKRSKLRNDFLQGNSDASCKKQTSLCVNLLRKVKKQYFSALDAKLITGSRNPKFDFHFVTLEIPQTFLLK